MPYGAAVVIGTDFADLENIASNIHVWAPETERNCAIAERSKAVEPQRFHDRGVTLYYYDPDESAEDTLISLLVTIDLHHGEFNQNPPWEFLQVHGLHPTDKVREALRDYGVTHFRESADGFVASRGIGNN